MTRSILWVELLSGVEIFGIRLDDLWQLRHNLRASTCDIRGSLVFTDNETSSIERALWWLFSFFNALHVVDAIAQVSQRSILANVRSLRIRGECSCELLLLLLLFLSSPFPFLFVSFSLLLCIWMRRVPIHHVVLVDDKPSVHPKGRYHHNGHQKA